MGDPLFFLFILNLKTIPKRKGTLLGSNFVLTSELLEI